MATKEICYKLIGYPLWHPLSRGHNSGGNKNFGRGSGRGYKNNATAHMIDNANIPPLQPSDSAPLPAPNNVLIFTSAQYAEILKLLVIPDFNRVLNQWLTWQVNSTWLEIYVCCVILSPC